MNKPIINKIITSNSNPILIDLLNEPPSIRPYSTQQWVNNPFIKVDKWIDAKSIIKDWNEEQINKKRKECQLWWHKYQKQLQEDILNTITL